MAGEPGTRFAGRPPAVEQIQYAVDGWLMAAGLDDVARAFVLRRRKRAELRKAKALLRVSDDLKLSLEFLPMATSS